MIATILILGHEHFYNDDFARLLCEGTSHPVIYDEQSTAVTLSFNECGHIEPLFNKEPQNRINTPWCDLGKKKAKGKVKQF